MVMSRFFLFTLLLIALPFQAGAAEISAHVDRNPVQLGESFRIVFEAIGSVDEEPDFAPLEDNFDILGSNKSSNISLINGSLSRKKVWALTLMGRKAGVFSIPRVSFGEESSPAIQLIVKEASAGEATVADDVLIEVEAEPGRPYLQAEIIYIVRLLHAVEIAQASLSEPQISGVEALVEKIGEDRNYETRRGGRRYLAVERRYALFAQGSGEMRIEPIRFEGQVASSARSLRVKRVLSEGIDLSIAPPPPAFAGGDWLPARSLTLTEAWPEEEPVFKVGEPVTRTLSLRAEGVTAAVLPELNQAMPEGVKYYPDRPLLENGAGADGVLALRQEKIALVPTEAGRFTLPPVEIPWWNTRADRMETASVAARHILVLPAEDAVPVQAVPASPPPKAEAPSPLPTPDPVGIVRRDASFWAWLSLALALGWGVTLFAVLIGRRKSRDKEASGKVPSPRERSRSTVRKIKDGCEKNDGQMSKSGLLEWGRSFWPEAPPASLGSLALRVGPLLRDEIEALNRSLYSREERAWEGEKLWAAFSKSEKRPKKEKSEKDGILEPLYPS